MRPRLLPIIIYRAQRLLRVIAISGAGQSHQFSRRSAIARETCEKLRTRGIIFTLYRSPAKEDKSWSCLTPSHHIMEEDFPEQGGIITITWGFF